MDLNAIVKQSHQAAVDAGWWESDKGKTPLEVHMLIVSEVVEATEAVRNNEEAFYSEAVPGKEGPKGHSKWVCLEGEVKADDIAVALQRIPGAKPEGEEVELADAVIRIFDWAGHKGWDMEAIIQAKLAYNATRGHRH